MAGVNGSDARTVVAVIGAGIMGSAMARNLAAAGLDTRVWDRSPAASAALADAGAAAAASAPDAVRDAGVVITMLPTAAAVESVIFDGGVAAAFAEGSVWAQMGTIGVQATLGFRDRLAAVRPGVTFVDAPVSGSKGPAEQGQLLILASGPETAASPLRPVFNAIGRKTVWLGQVGQAGSTPATCPLTRRCRSRRLRNAVPGPAVTSRFAGLSPAWETNQRSGSTSSICPGAALPC